MFFTYKGVRFVSAVPKVVLQKKQKKTRQMLDFETFDLKEEMGVQKGSYTQMLSNPLYF